MDKWYLKAAHAPDFEKASDYRLYRAFEILPGFLMWLTLLGTLILSYVAPIAASIFIIAFDVYWLLKTVFLSVHLRASFSQMQKNLETDWEAKLDELNSFPSELNVSSWHDIRHLVIIPFYQEPYDVIRGGLSAIAKSRYPNDKIFIVLACEERAGASARELADQADGEFGEEFGGFLITTHPANTPGETPGKGSNESFAAREAVKHLIDQQNIKHEHVLVSSFDVDTEVYPEYFGILTYHYLTACSRVFASRYDLGNFLANDATGTPRASRNIFVAFNSFGPTHTNGLLAHEHGFRRLKNLLASPNLF
jgi:hypothetical protein